MIYLYINCEYYIQNNQRFGAAERYMQHMTHKKDLSMFEIGICGAFSGIGIGTVLTPIEFVKCQMQAPHTTHQYKSTLDCVRYHLRRNPLVFSTGLYATLTREVPGTFVYFIAYKGTIRLSQYITNQAHTEDPSFWQIFCGGSAAGLAFWNG